MKRNYGSMDAYKVCFNAGEQIAAACQVSDTGSKYDMSAGSGALLYCAEVHGKYGQEGFDRCVVSDDMLSANSKYGS